MQARAGRRGGDPLSATTDRVLALLPDHDATAELVELLVGLDDAERRALSGPVRAATVGKLWWQPDPNLGLAVLACVSGLASVVKGLRTCHVPDGAESDAVRVLEARRPSWLPELPAALSPFGGSFRLVHALADAGLVEEPDTSDYALAMIGGLAPGYRARPGSSVLDCLRAHPRLLDRRLWTLLVTERAGRELTAHDGYWAEQPSWDPLKPQPACPGRTWRHALAALAAEGAIDRGRLLDVLLGVLVLDWAPVDLAWHLDLLAVLAPTGEEVRDRQAAYARLLRATPGRVVAVGLRALEQVQSQNSLDVDLVLDAVPAVLARSDKATVWRALSLLAALVVSRPEVAPAIGEVLTIAVEHPRRDVAERAAALLAAVRPGVAVEVAPAARGVNAATPPDDRPPEEIVPTASADEVAELLVPLLEGRVDPIAVERVLDGVLRWAGVRPGGSDALAQRAEVVCDGSWAGPWTGRHLAADLAALSLVWLGRRTTGAGPRAWPARGASTPAELLTRRVYEVCVAAEGGRPGVLLSLPSTDDGSLEAVELVRRVEAGAPLLPVDTALAVLRVPPERYADVRIPALVPLVEALQCYGPRWSFVVDDEERVHQATRYPFEARDAQPPVTWRDTAPLPAGADGVLAAVLDGSDPLAVFARGQFDGWAVAACWSWFLPHHPDLVGVWAHPSLHHALTRNGAGTVPVLHQFGEYRRPAGPPVQTALLLGLAARGGVDRAHAIDSIVDLGIRGLLDGAELGRSLGLLLRAGAVVGSRVASGLAEALRAEPATAGLLTDCLAAALDAVEGRRDAHQYVEVLADAAIAAGRAVRLPDTWRALARSSTRTQLARAVRRVPQPLEA